MRVQPTGQHPLLEQEYQRIASKKPLEGAVSPVLCTCAGMTPPLALDVARFDLPPPPASKRGDAAAWQEAVANAKSQLEHQSNRYARNAVSSLLRFVRVPMISVLHISSI